MRWELLFADLEGQLEAESAAELSTEVADRMRREVARLRMVDRLRGSLGSVVELQLPNGWRERGSVRRVGPDWLLLESAPVGAAAMEALVPLAAVVAVLGLRRLSAEPGTEGKVLARLDLRHALRALARDRTPVAALLLDGQSVGGVLDRVGADFVELSERDPGETAGGRIRLIPLPALVLVRRRPS